MLPIFLLLLAGAILMALRFVQLRRALLWARAGEAQFRLLAEHGRDAAFLLDATTLELLYISPAAQRLTGHDLPALRAHAASGGAQAVARLNDALNRKGFKWDYSVSNPTSGDNYYKK